MRKGPQREELITRRLNRKKAFCHGRRPFFCSIVVSLPKQMWAGIKANAGAKPYFFSIASSSLAAGSDEAGFWPVIRLPDDTT